MPRILAFIMDKIAEANGPLASCDPEPPATLRDKKVLYAEYIYKSNPQKIMQHRYFVVFKNKMEYYKAANIGEVQRTQPKGVIKFKDIDSYELIVEEDIQRSCLVMSSGGRDYKLKKFVDTKYSFKYSFSNARILQNIVTVYQDYKKFPKPNPMWVTAGSRRGIRIHEPSQDKMPLYDCEPILTQEQINMTPCTRVFTVSRISDNKNNIYGLVFSNTGLTLIDPESSSVVVHATSFKMDKKNYIGFHDSIGDFKNLYFRQNEYTLLGFIAISGILPKVDWEVEKLARDTIKKTYEKETALMNPLHILTQCSYFFGSDSLDYSNNELKDSVLIASSARSRQLIDSVLPLRFDENGNVMIPTVTISQVSTDLLNYRPELAENRMYLPYINPLLLNENITERMKDMRKELNSLREVYSEAQSFIQTVITHEDDFNPGAYPQFKIANMDRQVVGFYMSAYLPSYKAAFERNGWRWPGRSIESDSDCEDLNAYRHYYAEYYDLYNCFTALYAQLQSHLEAVIVNRWISAFLSGDYTTASKYMDFSITADRDSTIPTCLSRKHVLSLRRVFDFVADSLAEASFAKNITRFLVPPTTREHQFMYEKDTPFMKLEFQFVPELQTFKMITFEGKPFSSASSDNVFVNHGYTIGKVNNSISANAPFMVCINDSLEIVSLYGEGRFASFKYSQSGSKHFFYCTYMTDNNRTTIGGSWILDQSTCEMEWKGNKFNTANCYYRFHVDSAIPPNVALFMAVKNVYGRAESSGSNSLVQKVSNAYLRMIYHNINVADDKELIKMQASYMNLFDHPEIVPYTPLRFNRVDLFYSQTNSIEWKKTFDLEKTANKADLAERERREREERFRKMKDETLANLTEIERLMEEGKELKKAATGRAQLMVSNIFITRTCSRSLTREMIESETDEAKVMTHLDFTRSDLTQAGSMFDMIKNQVETNSD